MTDFNEADRSVLLVEDNTELAESMSFALAAYGWQTVGPASTRADALKSLDQDSFEVAILDIDLEGEMSFPVADALRSRAIPFVFLTGEVAAEEIPDRFAAEMLLNKPIQPESLIEALENGCRTSQG
ncbi:MAG: response regulator [Planctomycetota bacterium]|nr:response regulator [Planctomycetota bacterium]MEC8496012.1 response regulator [Planctomycetota bacterium]MEC8513020.1 response regulator [Planctomycetota bacterium]